MKKLGIRQAASRGFFEQIINTISVFFGPPMHWVYHISVVRKIC